MIRRKRYSEEDKFGILRQIELDLASGGTVEVAIYAWNWEKAEFELDIETGGEMIRRFEPGTNELEYATDHEIVTQPVFEEYVEELKQEIFPNRKIPN